MKEWKIVLTPEFKLEFIDIYKHIANVLQAPGAAKNKVKKILTHIEQLNEMPERFPIVENKLWRRRGLRKLIVDNYIIFYYPNRQTHEVVVFHVFYAGRNIDEML